jgi:C-C_Bond_Lyase of the TIM-Barrel fold
MRHFDFLSDADRQRLFFRPPQPFSADDDLNVLGMALGATLYSPATRPALVDDLAKRASHGVLSTVICLEDSIPDEAVRPSRTSSTSCGPMPSPAPGARWCSSGCARPSRSR